MQLHLDHMWTGSDPGHAQFSWCFSSQLLILNNRTFPLVASGFSLTFWQMEPGQIFSNSENKIIDWVVSFNNLSYNRFACVRCQMRYLAKSLETKREVRLRQHGWLRRNNGDHYWKIFNREKTKTSLMSTGLSAAHGRYVFSTLVSPPCFRHLALWLAKSGPGCCSEHTAGIFTKII